MTIVCRHGRFGSFSRFLFLTVVWIVLIDLPLVWSLAAFSSVNGGGDTGGSVLTTGIKNQNNGNGYCGVIVGKVIIDDYRRPDQPASEGKISVGGGGPQAAWGAAAALAVLEDQSAATATAASTTLVTTKRLTPTPPAQPIHFFGPIGQWSPQDDEALQKLLSPVVQYIHLIQEPSLQTPRIQLWHNEQQDIQWQPLNDSWGDRGADALWRNRPSAQDILTAITTKTTTTTTTNNNPPTIDNLHMILEVGAAAAGGGQDGLLLGDVTLMQHTKQVSVEPVAFPEEMTGLVSPQDAASCQSTLLRYPKIDLVVPDWHLFEALHTDLFWRKQFPHVAARYGPKGSRVIVTPGAASSLLPLVFNVPVATLATPDGMPINPTGAGNAYSAAVSTCLSKGLTLLDAACIGSAVGAVLCEHEQLPPWTWETMERIQEAAKEIQQKMATTGTTMKTEAVVDP